MARSSLSSAVNSTLKQMKQHTSTDKGSFGEVAVFKICEEFYQKQGGILYHSYSYKTANGVEGNLKIKDGELKLENTGGTTEIDVLLVTPYALFPIEVKAYKSKKITLTDRAIDGCLVTDKSPVHQNEMHARHLYEHIFKCIPNGNPEYIKPIVTFVDECTVVDNRSNLQKDYIYVSTLNTLSNLLKYMSKPMEFKLDLDAVDKALREVCTKYEKKLELYKL